MSKFSNLAKRRQSAVAGHGQVRNWAVFVKIYGHHNFLLLLIQFEKKFRLD